MVAQMNKSHDPLNTFNAETNGHYPWSQRCAIQTLFPEANALCSIRFFSVFQWKWDVGRETSDQFLKYLVNFQLFQECSWTKIGGGNGGSLRDVDHSWPVKVQDLFLIAEFWRVAKNCWKLSISPVFIHWLRCILKRKCDSLSFWALRLSSKTHFSEDGSQEKCKFS